MKKVVLYSVITNKNVASCVNSSSFYSKIVNAGLNIIEYCQSLEKYKENIIHYLHSSIDTTSLFVQKDLFPLHNTLLAQYYSTFIGEIERLYYSEELNEIIAIKAPVKSRFKKGLLVKELYGFALSDSNFSASKLEPNGNYIVEPSEMIQAINSIIAHKRYTGKVNSISELKDILYLIEEEYAGENMIFEIMDINEFE